MARMGAFPISVKVSGRRIVIAGGGAEALRKAWLAIKTEADILVVADRFEAEFASLPVVCAPGPLSARHLENAALLFVALEDENEAIAAARLGRMAGVPVNVVDRPELCDFYTPAIVDRAPVTVAISSDGRAPVLARLVRSRIEALLPPGLGRLARFAGGFRRRLHEKLPKAAQRRQFYEAIIGTGPVEAALAGGEFEQASIEAARVLGDFKVREKNTGHVWLVGAGPGAPDLLTLRAQRLLQEADVIVHDQLVPEAVIEMGRRDAVRIGVGKAKGRHSITQPKINAKLISLAKAGRRVVRLKSGDPMVFGRAGEEISALMQAGIGFTIVPGITAALAAAADTATPVTLRGVAPGFVLATAHGADNQDLAHWAGLAKSGLSLAIYMGKTVSEDVAAKLIENGLVNTTPVGLVMNAGRGSPTPYRGTLAEMAAGGTVPGDGPGLIFIGAAVAAGQWTGAKALSKKVRSPA